MRNLSSLRPTKNHVDHRDDSSEVIVALRVLTGWMNGQAPSLEDTKFLQSFKPELKHLPVDELACVVMGQHHRRN